MPLLSSLSEQAAAGQAGMNSEREVIGLVFQAFPDPMQEGGEEPAAPANTPDYPG